MRKLLAIVLALWLIPAAALCAPATPYDSGLMLRYYTLSDAQRSLFDLLYAAAAAGEAEVVFPENTGYADASAAMDALMADCPELCALSKRYTIRYYQHRPEIAVSIELSYDLPLSTQTELLRQAQAMTAQVSGDAYTRELFLHDALCARTTYDLTTAAQATAYGALVEGRAGCEGYADALILLCRLAGIPCGKVTGDAWGDGRTERHAWCVLSIGGAFTLTDPTWNDQLYLGNTHWYFNLSDAQMSRDHAADADIALPLCIDETLSWHARNGWLVPQSGGEEIIRRAVRLLATEKTAVNLRFESAAAAADFVQGLNETLTLYNQENPDAPFYGSYRVSVSESQGCVMVLSGE